MQYLTTKTKLKLNIKLNYFDFTKIFIKQKLLNNTVDYLFIHLIIEKRFNFLLQMNEMNLIFPNNLLNMIVLMVVQ